MDSNPESSSFAQASERPGRGGDVLGSVLGTLRLCGAQYCASDLSTPWAIHFAARPNPIFHVIDRGAAWLVQAGAVPLALVGGDVVLLPHGDAHTLADEAGRTPRVVDFADHPQIRSGGGPAIWGGGGARTLLVCGQFHVEGPALQPLVSELPPCILLRAGEASQWLTMTLRLLAHEALGMEPGADVIRERLVEIIFVHCLRGWLRAGGATRRGWLAALREPSIARALSLLHQRPAAPWTVEELARGVALSRSVFADRFAAAVGEPPLTYLTRWRMQLSAARLLADPGESLKAVAMAVGYQSEAAWNRAFRRFAGLPPAQWRQAQAAARAVR
jgi:AraC-like DNA-binding protein